MPTRMFRNICAASPGGPGPSRRRRATCALGPIALRSFCYALACTRGGALVSSVARLQLADQDDRLRWGNEQLLLGSHADDLPALRPQLVQLLLDLLAGIDDLVLVALHETTPPRIHTRFGTLPVRVKSRRIALCPGSAVGPNMQGQPPSITEMPRSLPYAVAVWETLPAPGPRCIQMCLIPSSAHSPIVCSAISGRVPITTASTPPGIELRLWYARSPSTTSAFGLTAKTS